MKSMQLPSVAIFFMIFFHKVEGGGMTLLSPGSATAKIRKTEFRELPIAVGSSFYSRCLKKLLTITVTIYHIVETRV